MSYKGQVLRGEKWYNICKTTKDPDKIADIEIYKESCQKIKEEKAQEKRNKGNK